MAALNRTLLVAAYLGIMNGGAFATESFELITPTIVGGEIANTSQWGFYTQLVSRNGNRSFCGASYLGDGYVLTAAHCVDNDSPDQLAVKVGGFQYNGSDGQRANVSNIYIHPSFNASTLSNDIAILKIDRDLPTAKRVEIAQGALTQYAAPGDILSVAGLGRLQEGGSSPVQLMAVDIPLVSDAVCQQAGGSYANVGAVSFCAGTAAGGKDSCQGDSGGPIVINQGGVITQLGIVSWGIGCARPGKYGVYSDIAELRSWVDSIITTPSNNVAVGYTASQQLSDFDLGQIKSHQFEITNIGMSPFTVNNFSLTAGGVATSVVEVSDSCRQTQLNAESSCYVAIEFSAASAGQASVTLDFTIDQTTTTYRAIAVVNVSDTSTPDTCDKVWDTGQVYNSGDVVLWEGKLWQAQWWNQGSNPSSSGEWGVWQLTDSANCGGSLPVPPTPEPTPPTSGTPYVAGASYQSGDIVSHNGATYECLPWPNGLWCSESPIYYEPGVGSVWQDTWKQL
ncbi:trypsin-like serine protease [Photobacterium minamisatsumaniensis]